MSIVLWSAAPAAAQVVVNGGAPNEGSGWNIFDDNRAAAMFSVGAPISFDAIRFWALLPDGPALHPNIYWQILEDAGGAPGATVAAEGNAAAGGTLRKELDAFKGFFSWEFDIATASQSLGDGVYWLALHDGPLDVGGFTASNLVWETTDTPGQYAIQTFTVDDDWDVNPDVGLAFQLSNDPVATPEPGTFALLASGLAIVAGAIRRRRRSASSVQDHAITRTEESTSI